MTSSQNSEFSEFKRAVRLNYKKHKRDLPWRGTPNPYHILVSEVMLQQTQVERVLPKYNTFIKKFPTPQSLSKAKLRDVLTLWNGLGYNRRAKALHEATKIITSEYSGKISQTKEALMKLPGVGPYTARAVLTFAFNRPEIFIETNIRTVFIHHFFKNKQNIKDIDILNIIEKTLDTKNPREWYFALMDYGSMLKEKYPNPNRQSAHYTKQSRFEGSNRQLRGKIIKLLIEKKRIEKGDLARELKKGKKITEKILNDLIKENLITESRRVLELS